MIKCFVGINDQNEVIATFSTWRGYPSADAIVEFRPDQIIEVSEDDYNEYTRLLGRKDAPLWKQDK